MENKTQQEIDAIFSAQREADDLEWQDEQWRYIRLQRDDRIKNLMWRFERYNSQKLSGVITDESQAEIQSLGLFVQQLRDLTETYANDPAGALAFLENNEE